MQLSVTFRKIETTEPIKAYVQDKIKKIKKFFPEPINAHVVLTLERYQHRADVNITLHNGLVLKSQEKTGDMYSAIDLAMDKIERQIRKYKDKIRRHKPQNGPQFAVRPVICKLPDVGVGRPKTQALPYGEKPAALIGRDDNLSSTLFVHCHGLLAEDVVPRSQSVQGMLRV